MKTIHFLLASLLLATPFCGMAKKVKNNSASHHIVSVDNWTSLTSTGSFDITIKIMPDSVGSVRVIATDCLFEKMRVVAQGSNLEISYKPDTRVHCDKSPKIIAYSDGRLESVVLTGSGDIRLPALNTNSNLMMTLTGSGEIKAPSIKASDIKATLTGSGDIEVEKATVSGSIQLTLTGSGDIEFNHISANTLNASLQGSGDIDISGKANNVNLVVNGTGDIDAARLKALHLSAVATGPGGITFGEAKTVKAKGPNVRQSKKIKH